jgi:serine/threonine protein kinase
MPMLNRPAAVGEQPGLKKVGRYECIDQIGGDGGFETYRARIKGLTGLDRSFAVKVLRLKRSENPATVSDLFVQAAKRSAALADPHIAKVVEADPAEGLVFAVTPFMEGLDLGHFLQLAREAALVTSGKDDKTNPWHTFVAYLGAEIARGLQVAHGQKPPLIHGALCPGNVFITSRGAVQLLDFGLRASIRRPFEPRPRRLLPYIAPELAAPASDSTKAGDMYTLGVLLFELASGELPPQGRRPTDTQIALSLLPEKLGLIIGRLLSFSPAARPGADDAVSSLTAVYAGSTEENLAGDLSTLVQRLSSNSPDELPMEPSEAVVLLPDAPAEVDDAPPPPSEVEHEDVYGFEGPPARAAANPVVPEESLEAVDESFALPEPEDELSASHEQTAVGDQSLIDDLLAQSRPPAAPVKQAVAFPDPSPVPDLPAAPSIVFPPALAEEYPDGVERVRGPTLRGFGPTGSADPEAPTNDRTPGPEAGHRSIEGWALTPAPERKPRRTSSSSLPALAESPAFPGEPSLLSDMENAPEQEPASAYDAPPATWGARALAALGNQAGISPSADEASTGLGLLDHDLPESAAAPFVAPPVATPVSRLHHSQTLAIVDGPMAPPELADAVSTEAALGVGMLDGENDPTVAGFEAPAEAEPPRGDALLEDELVDSPEAARPNSSWATSPISGPFGALGQTSAATISPVVYASSPPVPVAEATAFVAEQAEPARGTQAFLDEAAPSAAASAYFDDADKPLPMSELAASRAALSAAPPSPGPEPPVAKRGRPDRRPATQQASVPNWAKSPENANRPSRRRLVWVIAATVLGTSVAFGGLAGFLVGSRGRSWMAMLGRGQPPALSSPKAAPVASPVESNEGSEAMASPVPTVAKAVPGANPTVTEKVAAPKAAAPAEPARAPAVVAKAPPPTKPVVPAASEKTATNPAPAAWDKGVPDSGTGLVNLSVTSQPAGASVWINGKERGRTPLQANIQSGPAQVVLILTGHATATLDVNASEGTKVSKDLAPIEPPMTGEARFRAECTTQGKLPIVVDGKETGVLCPFTKLRVDPGVHKIGLFVPSLGKVREKEVTLHSGVRSIVFTD